jgi:basic membrane protein A
VVCGITLDGPGLTACSAVRRWWSVAALAACLALSPAACGGDSDGSGSGDGGPLKVAFVYVSPIGRAGWTHRHDEGRKELERTLGDAVETTYLESVPEGAQAERVFEDLARKGFDLIFGTSFGYMDPMVAVARRYPDTVFLHVSGFKTGANLGTYFGAAEEGRYLTGIAAGRATATGRIGYVAAFPIPEVLRGINAFTLGVRSVRPDATVRVAWTSNWSSPETETQAAESLLAAGVDVLTQHQDTPATGEAAEAAGAKWVGYHDDMSAFAPTAWLTASTWDWGPFYVETARRVIDGTWKSGQYYGGIADGLVDLAPFGPSVDAETRRLIAERRAAIEAGSFAPFTGPVRDQAGRERIAAGEKATLGELLATDYLVEGVVGDIPAQ